jgi:hypothetical protein
MSRIGSITEPAADNYVKPDTHRLGFNTQPDLNRLGHCVSQLRGNARESGPERQISASRNWDQLGLNCLRRWLEVVDFMVARDGIGIWLPAESL